jgi:hypothetical protein
MHSQSVPATESRARRAARRAGLIVRKSRWRLNSNDNYGGFMIVDPSTNIPVYGFQCDLDPQEVIDYCAN